MNRVLLLIVTMLVLASCRESSPVRDRRFRISFPGEPVTLFDNIQAGKQVINYFNIVQTGESEYRMYYIAVENGVKIEEFAHNLYVAWSDDLVHWHLENPLGGSDLIMEGILEQSVCYTPGDDFPYRLVGNIWEDGRYKLCMWQSRDGIEFVNRKVVLEDRMHDSQCVIIPEKDYLKLYYRQSIRLGPGHYDRRVVLRHLDLEGNPITDMEFITGDYEYNSAASRIAEGYDLLLPTYFNNAPGRGDSCSFKAFIQHGFYSQEIECPLNAWIGPDEKWFLAAPGILHHDGKDYIAYCCRNTSHDQGCVDSSCYKLAEIQLTEYDDKVALNPNINQSSDGIQTGDLLFVGIPSSSEQGDGMSGAIADATGSGDVNFIHAAILEVDSEGQVWVIDATPERGVHRHPLDTLFRDFALEDGSRPYCEVMRLPDNRRAESYVANAKSFIGEEYDLYFLPDNGRHYCTELVQDSYRDFGMYLFKGKPMNFKNADGEFPLYWRQLFASLGQDVPQGVLGTNPQDMHDDERLQRVPVRFTPVAGGSEESR